MTLKCQSPHTEPDKSPATSKINFLSCCIPPFFINLLARASFSILCKSLILGLKAEGRYSPMTLGILIELFTVYSTLQHVQRWWNLTLGLYFPRAKDI